MIKKILVFVLLFCFSVIIMVILYTYSTRGSSAKNDFNRILSKKKGILKRTIMLEKEEFYSIAEITSGYITLNKFNKPYEMIKVSMDLNNKQPYRLSILKGKEKFSGLNSVSFINNSTFVLSGRSSMAYKMTNDGNKLQANKLDSLPFYHSEVVSANSFVFISKSILGGINRRKLKKTNWQGQELNSYVPEKQIDGYFDTDGTFRYDRSSNRLIYMFFYRGVFTCLDTNINVIYQAKTIDTVKRSKIYLKFVKDQVTQSQPPSIINKRFCIADNKIYLQSALKADNEDKDQFENSDVVDIYTLKDGKYTVSFYLPKLRKQRLTAFGVYKKKLIALYNNILAVYEIP